MDVARHDADLALTGLDNTRAVGSCMIKKRSTHKHTNQTGLALLCQRILDLHHVLCDQCDEYLHASTCWGMPSVMQTISGISASRDSRMAPAAKGGGT
jgi:hypothetical protein